MEISTHIILLTILPLILQLVGLSFAISVDAYIDKKHRWTMVTIVLMVFLLVAQNYVGYSMDVNGTMPYARTIVGIMGYILRPLILLMYFYIISDERGLKVGWILIGINTVVHLTALFSGICFSIDDANVFHRGPLGFTCHIVSAMLLTELVYITIKEYGKNEKRGLFIPLFNAFIIVAAVLMDTFVDYRDTPVNYLTIAVVSSNLFFFIWLHFQFEREHEEALKAEQRIHLMISQIQPHFLYNTLSTIQALCRLDPEMAAEVTETFGRYLRQNLDSLLEPNLIPIKKELEHTKAYSDIEAVRFPMISVDYRIEEENFKIPALTIQPLVENAVKHGVRGKDDGLVEVITEHEPDNYKLIIRDNGKGFDSEEMKPKDDRSHIGLLNVKERIESMCGGTMTIESIIGEGTTITIRIPKTIAEDN